MGPLVLLGMRPVCIRAKAACKSPHLAPDRPGATLRAVARAGKLWGADAIERGGRAMRGQREEQLPEGMSSPAEDTHCTPCTSISLHWASLTNTLQPLPHSRVAGVLL